ncbi:MAG TPA: GH25 family lysozyme [Kofleriaceae bacterium]
MSCTIGEPLDDDAVAGDGIAEEANTEVDDPLSVRVCPAAQTVFGIDVSHHQGLIDWTKVKGGGVKYAFIRISDGATTRDRQFSRNWTNAKAAGVMRGAYQFFRPSQNVATQAQMMIDAIAGSSGDLPPVIDVEVDGGLAPATVASRVKQWVDKVSAATGRTPIVYTAKYFWRDEVGNSASLAANPLWVANYTTRCPDIPSAWKAWQFWQTSATGRVPGIVGDVDMNKFNGTQLQLEALTR